MPLFETHWTKHLVDFVDPLPFDPGSKIAIDLEAIRTSYKIPHKEFAYVFMTSAIYFRALLEGFSDALRYDYPNASDKQILSAVTALCAYLNLEKTKGIVTYKQFERGLRQFRSNIESAMQNPDNVLNAIQAQSLDEIAAKYFNSIGTYRKVPDAVLGLYRKIDALGGMRFDGSYDYFRNRVIREFEREIEQRERANQFHASIGRVSRSDFDLMLDSMMGGGADLDAVVAEIAARRQVSEEDVRTQFRIFVQDNKRDEDSGL